MDPQRQLASLEEEGLLIVAASPLRLLTRMILGLVLMGFGATLSLSMLVELASPAHIFLRPALWAGAALLAAGAWLTRLALAARAQLILTEDGFAIEHRDRGRWTTIHRVAWKEVIFFVAAAGTFPPTGRSWSRIPGVIGADPQRLTELLRAAHRCFS